MDKLPGKMGGGWGEVDLHERPRQALGADDGPIKAEDQRDQSVIGPVGPEAVEVLHGASDAAGNGCR